MLYPRSLEYFSLQAFNTSTMYGCLDAFLIYGWCQNDRDNLIDSAWLEDNKVDAYAMDVVRNTAGEFIYGLPCDIDEETGVLTISEEDKKCVEDAHTKSGSKEKLVFRLGMRGDGCDTTCHMTYKPDQPEAEDEVAGHTSALSLFDLFAAVWLNTE